MPVQNQFHFYYMKSIILLFSFFISLSFFACVDDSSSIGAKWVQSSFLNEQMDTCTVLLSTVLSDSIATSGVNEVTNRKASVEAGILRAQAALEMARLNLSYTAVTAPCDGTLGRRALEDGQFVQGGQSLTYIIPDTQKWVIANYKETQIANLYEGQKVSIKVDAFPDKEFSGHISAISGATGSKYSLVPTDNSAGNFVKIQQRIPVRIEFDELSEEDNRLLAAGMMVIIKAKL